jgi:hypothetical protein
LHLGQLRFRCHIREADEIRPRLATATAQTAQHRDRFRREAQNRTTGERTIEPLHVVERRLVARRQLCRAQKSVERLAGCRRFSRAKQPHRLVERLASLRRQLRSDAPHLLELSHGAVRSVATNECVDQL